jgi:hypothetical protein
VIHIARQIGFENYFWENIPNAINLRIIQYRQKFGKYSRKSGPSLGDESKSPWL